LTLFQALVIIKVLYYLMYIVIQRGKKPIQRKVQLEESKHYQLKSDIEEELNFFETKTSSQLQLVNFGQSFKEIIAKAQDKNVPSRFTSTNSLLPVVVFLLKL